MIRNGVMSRLNWQTTTGDVLADYWRTINETWCTDRDELKVSAGITTTTVILGKLKMHKIIIFCHLDEFFWQVHKISLFSLANFLDFRFLIFVEG